MTGEELAQGFGVDPSAVQRGVKAAPAATVRGFEAQVSGRTNGASGEHGVAKLEEGVCPAMEAFVE
jgi:hypothetical protein